MEKLTAIIVDDEFNCRNNLNLLVEEFCPNVQVAGLADSADAARQLIDEHEPDLVFLDIKMPKEDGFTFLKSMPDHNFSVVFTTAHHEFALKAFRQSAVDYIEKPINIDDLQSAVKKVMKMHAHKGAPKIMANDALQHLIENAIHFKEMEKTTIPTRDGFAMVKSCDIVHLEASDCYTSIYLADGRRFLSSKNIKVYEENLNSKMFFRTHKSHIINVMYHLKEFSRTDGNIAIMSNGVNVPISRRKTVRIFETNVDLLTHY